MIECNDKSNFINKEILWLMTRVFVTISRGLVT